MISFWIGILNGFAMGLLWGSLLCVYCNDEDEEEEWDEYEEDEEDDEGTT